MIVFYARVSTTEQTTAHQRTQAEQAGFKIDRWSPMKVSPA